MSTLCFQNECFHLEAIVSRHLKLTCSFIDDVGALFSQVQLCFMQERSRHRHEVRRARCWELVRLHSRTDVARIIIRLVAAHVEATRHSVPIPVLGVQQRRCQIRHFVPRRRRNHPRDLLLILRLAQLYTFLSSYYYSTRRITPQIVVRD